MTPLRSTALAHETSSGAAHAHASALYDVRVDDRRAHVLVRPQFLYRPDVGAALQEMGGKAVLKVCEERVSDTCGV